jgi:hypothetical protein
VASTGGKGSMGVKRRGRCVLARCSGGQHLIAARQTAVLLIDRHLRASKNGIIDSRADRITGVAGAVCY